MKAVAMENITTDTEFYLTGAFAKGVTINGKRYLIVTQIEEDTFCDGEDCNERVLNEYGL